MSPPPFPVAPPVPQPVLQDPPVFAKKDGWFERRRADALSARQMQQELGVSATEAARIQIEAKLAGKGIAVPSRSTSAKQKTSKTTPARTASGAVSPDRLRVVNRWALEEQIEVAGETHHIKAIKTVLKQAGKTITARAVTLDDVPTYLCPEPSNEFDRNAVMVMVGIYVVGYLPAEIAGDYSLALLNLARRGEAVGCQSRIWARLEGGMARARVTLMAPEANELP